VDPFTVVVVVGLVALGVVFWLLGRYYPGSGLEQVGLRSAREVIERREELDAEDLDQMMAAHNARRRARGQAEVTAEEIEAQVLRERAEHERRPDPADRERRPDPADRERRPDPADRERRRDP
jgi:hypothetical protein